MRLTHLASGVLVLERDVDGRRLVYVSTDRGETWRLADG